MGKVFIVADTHFNHKKILEYENRPYGSVEEMEKSLIRNWNSVVGKEDTVYHLGDFGFCNIDSTSSILSRLNGNKNLIMGNHDRRHSIRWWMDAGFNKVYDKPIIYRKFLVLSHEPPEYFNTNTPYIWIYGHVHGCELYQTTTKNSICACVERWDYKPFDIDYVLSTNPCFLDIVS